MKIIELRVDNFARLKAVEIRPDGTLVPITGKNGQGKTSVLRAIWALIEGRAAAPAVAIREGEAEATIHGDLGDYKITRTIRRNEAGMEDWTLKVVAADGSRVAKTPQAVINAFKGDVAFDPLGWCRLPARDQLAALRSLVDFDFAAAARSRQNAYQERTTINRRVAEREAQANAIVLPPGPAPKPVDVSAKIDELARASGENTLIQQRSADRDRGRRQVDAWMDEAEQLHARAMTIEKKAKDLDALLDAEPPIGDFLDVSAIRAEIAEAEKTKAVIQLFEDRRTHMDVAVNLRTQSDKWTETIAQLDRLQREAVAAAKLPVEGLSLGEDAVLLNGLPLEQAGTAQKIECAVALAMAKNPKLKVITIDEGSELDSEALAHVAKLAEARGFQIWVARVDETKQVGFVIEDGRVAP